MKSKADHGLNAMLVLAAWALLGGCETEEETHFGDPARVSGGFASTSSGAPACTVNTDCDVSFQDDVFAEILVPAGGCGATGCHETSIGGFVFDETNAQAACWQVRSEFWAYITAASGVAETSPFCNPATSHLLCTLPNMLVASCE